MSIADSFLQSAKIPPPMLVTVEGIVMVCSCSQALKAVSSMLFRPSDNCTEDRLTQLAKALSEMVSTLAGMLTSPSASHPLKDQRPI